MAPLCKGSCRRSRLRGCIRDRGQRLHLTLTAKLNLCSAAVAASAPSEEGAGAPEGYKGATEGEITRGRCLRRSVDEHGAKKRSFAFTFAYIKCFRTYSLYLSLRLPAQILYAGIHLPPQREARALPRRAQIFPPRFRRRGEAYPFSFVTKRKAVRRCRKVSPLTFSLALFTSAIKELVCPFAVLRSRFGFRYSRTCGRQRLAFLAVSATGGARKPNPSGEGHRPLAVRSDSPPWQYPIKMCRHGRHT